MRACDLADHVGHQESTRAHASELVLVVRSLLQHHASCLCSVSTMIRLTHLPQPLLIVALVHSCYTAKHDENAHTPAPASLIVVVVRSLPLHHGCCLCSIQQTTHASNAMAKYDENDRAPGPASARCGSSTLPSAAPRLLPLRHPADHPCCRCRGQT